MNPIARVEHACARFVEEAFARVFPGDLDPAQVGRKLAAAMQAAPADIFVVRVHPVDYVRLAADRDFLEARWSALLREAQPPGRTQTPRALLHEDRAVVAGSVAIETIVDERPGVVSPALFLARADGTRVPLCDGLRIGRSSENDIVVRDGRASRRHARIVARDGGYAIEDAASSNGTFIDGARVASATLAPGVTVTIGDTHFTVARDAG